MDHMKGRKRLDTLDLFGVYERSPCDRRIEVALGTRGKGAGDYLRVYLSFQHCMLDFDCWGFLSLKLQ